MFLDNKYTRIYYQIIEVAKTRTLEGYKERHHIIPKSLGGNNSKENLVNLTAREHFICHWLLTKMTTSTGNMKMFFALSRMRASNVMHQRYHTKITARVYEHVRIKNAEHRSILFTGKKLSDEHRNKISKAHTGKIGHPVSPETREKLRITSTGRKHTPEALQKMSEWQRGKKITGTHLENLRRAAKNKPPVKEETRKKLSEAGKGRKRSPEAIAKFSEARKGHFVSEETREKIRNTLRETYIKKGYKVYDPNEVKVPYVRKGKKASEETKAKMRKPKSPETREKMRLASIAREAKKREEGYVISEETRAKLSARHREQRTCTHCGYTSTKAVIARHHMDNCKHKILDNKSK